MAVWPAAGPVLLRVRARTHVCAIGAGVVRGTGKQPALAVLPALAVCNLQPAARVKAVRAQGSRAG